MRSEKLILKSHFSFLISHSLSSDYTILLAGRNIEAEQAEQHFGVGSCIFRVELEAGTLCVLNCVGLAVCGILFEHRLGDRVAEVREAAILLPVLEEVPTQCMLDLREIERVRPRCGI